MKKRLALLLALCLCFSFAACSPTADPPPDDGPGQTVDPGDGPGQNQDDDGEDDQNPDDQEPDDQKEGVLDPLVKNFWQETTMYDESVLFIAEEDANGNVTSAPKATLLFDAKKVISVKQYFHADHHGEIYEFEEGKDFTVEGNVLTAVGSIVDDEFTGKKRFDTKLPYVTDRQLTGESSFFGLSSKDIPSTTDGLYLPFTEGYQIVQMQASVTYEHDKTWQGAVAYYHGDALEKTVQKLKNKQKIELFVWGDSISTGANSSSVLGITPNLPTWPELLKENLASYYGAEVSLTNKAVGGWQASNGVRGGTGWVGGKQITQLGLADLLRKEMPDYKPDIALIGFGMNDATAHVTADTFGKNIKSMIETLRTRNPDCEIVLLGTMLANPMAKLQSQNQTEMTDMLYTVSRLFENVCVVDIGTMHRSILDAGKHYTEISSNNVNHPNDFMARVYAMNLLTALIEEEGDAAPVRGENNALERYREEGYSVLFSDPYFTRGVEVYDSDNRKTGTILFENSEGGPSWRFSQWGSKYDLYATSTRHYSRGGMAVSCVSDGKKIGGEVLPAKILNIDAIAGSVYMELNAETEYDAPRQDGESWPHTLLSQDFDGNLVHVPELKSLVMDIDYTVTKCEDKMNGEADPTKHCAQLVWYITLQNRTRGSAGYGQYIWFGLNLWDNRNVGRESREFAAQDLGKPDATKAFIYQPSSAVFLDGGKIPAVGVRASVNFNALPVARQAFLLAKERGYLTDTEWDDIYIGAMNFGFENTGTYNSAAKIDTVGVYYKK